MSLLDSIRSLVSSDKLHVEAKYELLREAVTGSMSTFHMARDRKTGEVVGLKLLNKEKTDLFESRFKHLGKPSEGEIACSIDHPRVVKTFRHGVSTKGQQYIISEFLDGPVLSALILARDEILEGKRLILIRQMAEAVHAVHEAGYIHRDICPRNFICTSDATSLKLIDFGLSVPMKKEFMQPGNRTGTASYLAPEIVRRKPTDHRVDIFALGVSAYYLCTFVFPWPGHESTGKAALQHDTQPAEDILTHMPQMNRKLAALIMECIAVSPHDRPATAEAIVRRLKALRGDNDA